MRPSARTLIISVLGILAVTLVSVSAGLAPPGVAWRLKVLSAKLTGEIPEIPLLQLIRWMSPGSPVNLYHLSELPNVNTSITNAFDDRQSGRAGALIFARACAQCHGADAQGAIGPNLLAAIGDLSDWKFLSTVKWGRPNTNMRPVPISELEIWQVEAYLRQTAVDAAVGKKTDSLPAYQPVTPEMLREAGTTGDWLTYAGNYSGYRYTPEKQINRQNVQSLQLAWAAQLPSDGGPQESSPIVVGERIFVTEPPEGVTALDAKTGTVLWQFHRAIPPNIPLCCGSPNRGLAVLGRNLYVATFDSHLLSLDAANGVTVWDTKVADWHQSFTMTAAPLALDDRIIVGVGGGDFGVRGFLAAYSALDGSELWRFYTVPGPGEPGHETWGGGDAWTHGGAATWVTGAYDAALGLIYWGTGNPGPVFSKKVRPGTNLYSSSVVAVDARTGKLRWYYQFTPSDSHGWDSTEQPVLADIVWQGETVPALLMANRNAFFYALDRRTGRFLFARPFAKQTWASGFTEDGRPIVIPGTDPTQKGTEVSPPLFGATSWWPPAFDPSRRLLFIPSVDSVDTFFSDDNEKFHQGRSYLAGGYLRAHKPTTLALRAVDVSNGALRWDSTIESGGGEVPGLMGGLLSTGGDLVFAGHEEEFDAYDADTGAVLWSTHLGGRVYAAPVSYRMGAQQYIGVFAGRALFMFTLPRGEQVKVTQSSPAASRPASNVK